MPAVIVCEFGDRDEFLIRSMFANRRHPHLARIVGFLANAVILRLRMAGSPTLLESLRRFHATALAAYAHAEFPTAMLIPIIGPSPDPAFAIRPQVAHFHRRLSRPQVTDLPGVSSATFVIAPELVEERWQYDGTLVTEEHDGQIECALWYNKDVLDESGAARFVGRFQEICQSL